MRSEPSQLGIEQISAFGKTLFLSAAGLWESGRISSRYFQASLLRLSNCSTCGSAAGEDRGDESEELPQSNSLVAQYISPHWQWQQRFSFARSDGILNRFLTSSDTGALPTYLPKIILHTKSHFLPLFRVTGWEATKTRLPPGKTQDKANHRLTLHHWMLAKMDS